MNDKYEKTISIIKELRELPDLNETPLFTWDEMNKRENRAAIYHFILGIVVGGFLIFMICALLFENHIKPFA